MISRSVSRRTSDMTSAAPCGHRLVPTRLVAVQRLALGIRKALLADRVVPVADEDSDGVPTCRQQCGDREVLRCQEL